ncbi:hypothetical protein CBM2626_A40043 [Cupriavidus taiwanensis]|uniref:Uncharacterized protein n=1 Tax=Cupriavidus taiwanensis TaxID=164546 RepID=A0A976G2S5_9BURK|nr:hypothetical protein CBM2615_A60028 [Cupriavidus taiwanensis]SOZ60035.1 hypothetical protein CBM2614_A60027 [Cupriavidus taiwanensis]SOZ63680.1 hypothetical protein CBM2613_A50027 [Cupriavidus taiwanensis]SOZ99498.1 hypothetical protein CBM2626_A40043 [Cupriavidus taiwanensis]SPA06491.1 hypothetical protein CBM2625_A50027 [Cupriavidus taiwanensis]
MHGGVRKAAAYRGRALATPYNSKLPFNAVRAVPPSGAVFSPYACAATTSTTSFSA